MDNNNQAKTEEQIDASLTNQRPRPKTMLATAVAISVLVLAASSLYLGWSYHRQSDHAAKTIAQLEQDVLLNSNHIQSLTQNLSRTEQELQHRMAGLNKNLHDALQQRLYQKQDWLLLKTRHFLELAQVNLHWSNDNKASIALLQQANTLLGDVSDHRVFPIRQTIAKEITRLQAMPVIDIPGLLSQLDAAQDMALKLPMHSIVPNTPSHHATGQSRLHDNLSLLEKLVVIQHHDEDIKPILSPLHQTMMRESIRLSLQEAQWAILQTNQDVYQHALQQALTNTKRIFDLNAQSTKAFITILQALQEQNLMVEKPVISESLQQLNQVIDTSTPGEQTS